MPQARIATESMKIRTNLPYYNLWHCSEPQPLFSQNWWWTGILIITQEKHWFFKFILISFFVNAFPFFTIAFLYIRPPSSQENQCRDSSPNICIFFSRFLTALKTQISPLLKKAHLYNKNGKLLLCKSLPVLSKGLKIAVCLTSKSVLCLTKHRKSSFPHCYLCDGGFFPSSLMAIVKFRIWWETWLIPRSPAFSRC